MSGGRSTKLFSPRRAFGQITQQPELPEKSFLLQKDSRFPSEIMSENRFLSVPYGPQQQVQGHSVSSLDDPFMQQLHKTSLPASPLPAAKKPRTESYSVQMKTESGLTPSFDKDSDHEQDGYCRSATTSAQLLSPGPITHQHLEPFAFPQQSSPHPLPEYWRAHGESLAFVNAPESFCCFDPDFEPDDICQHMYALADVVLGHQVVNPPSYTPSHGLPRTEECEAAAIIQSLASDQSPFKMKPATRGRSSN
eukprot:c8443_g1_i1.p1 GENE.c8443_g1_i1~~c8443_g1_i1.p1  ORF type:complete len:251 (+),score=37.91 c8443_g1_i1:156-908(+)